MNPLRSDKSDLRNETIYLQERADEWVSRRAKQHGLSRRRFLEVMGTTAVGAFLAACATTDQGGPNGSPTSTPTQPSGSPTPGGPPIVKGTPSDLFNLYSSNAEMKWEAMSGRGYMTPTELFFVRNHTRTPEINADSWRLRIEGSGVQRAMDVSLDDIRGLRSKTIVKNVECAGNGRSFFETFGGRKADGTQWKLGAIGVAEWTGVPLRDVLDMAGLKQSTRDVMPEGLDDLRVRRPMSAQKAMDDETMLVYQMNGQPLPPDHGSPVRVLVPGWIGVANIKWVGRMEVSEEPIFSPWNTESYVLIGDAYQPQGNAKGPVLTTQNVKSALELPWPASLRSGQQTIRGRSWSGVAPIAKVEYSIDDGRTWQEAQMQDPNTAAAWARWQFDWDARPGTAGIRVRATDTQGNSQPESVPFNQQGYLYNAVVNHPVTVS